MKKGIILLFAFILLSGCGVVKRGTIPWDENGTDSPPALPESGEDTVEKTPESFVEESEPSAIQEMQEFLQLAYKDWKGVPYVLGGSGYSGIDCSAFMQVVFEDYFSVLIPRTTREQLNAGTRIKRRDIKTGDLVFFKTGSTTYHVGVAINKDEFLHASTTNGVKISDLSHPYWQETYLTSRRIF